MMASLQAQFCGDIAFGWPTIGSEPSRAQGRDHSAIDSLHHRSTSFGFRTVAKRTGCETIRRDCYGNVGLRAQKIITPPIRINRPRMYAICHGFVTILPRHAPSQVRLSLIRMCLLKNPCAIRRRAHCYQSPAPQVAGCQSWQHNGKQIGHCAP